MAESKRTFIAGKMNQDIDERMLPDGQYRSASNITIEATGGSNMGAAQNALGNEILFDLSDFLIRYKGLVVTGAKTIGAVKYEPLSLLYWFVTSDQFDGIFEYNQNSNTTSLILGSTTNQLNFDSLSLITGVNYIYSDSGSYLFWTDNLNPPRRINISRVRGYGIDDSRINIDINVVLRPPLNSPSIFLDNDNVILSNNLEEKFLYFSYRYKYIDNEFSSMSPFSSVAFNAKMLSFDPTTGDNIGMLNKNNIVTIGFETGNQFVKEIQILARDTRSLNVVIVENLNKSELNIPDNSSRTFDFRNNKIYATLTSDQVTRMFDNVPLKALAQDVVGNRLIYGNYTQFRDVSDLNYVVDYINLSLTNIATIANPKRTFRSDRDYEVGIVYSDEYGRLTTVLTSNSGNIANSSSNSVFIPPTKSSTANSLKTTIKSLPPSWATKYRLYIKQSKKDYYNLFPISFQVKGEYRYIQISESDRDKVSVGEYIIFKTANAQPTNTNRKFKVLEVELKASNALNTNSPAGLYLKIKPDAISAASFLAAPVLITTNSPSWVTAGQFPYSTCLSGPGDTTKYPFCFPSVSFFYDRIHYRAGSNIFSAGGNGAPDITLSTIGASNFYCYTSDVRLKIRIVNNPSDPNGNSPTHFIINSDPLNQSTWTQPIAIGPGYSVSSTVVSYGGGTTYLTFGTGVYVLGDEYVLNVRGFRATQSGFAIRNAIGGDGIPASSTQPTPNSSNPQTCNLSLDSSVGHMDYYGKLMVGFKGPIYPGAIIKISVTDRDSSVSNTTLPTSSRLYPSFEEYWYEECNGNFPITIKADGTTSGTSAVFRWVTTPIPNSLPCGPNGQSYVVSAPFPINGMLPATSTYMSALFITAFCDRNGNCNRTSNYISGTLQQAESPTYIVETVPLDVETPIFHETMKTYPIIGGFHKVGWQYSSNSSLGSIGSNFQIQLNSSYFHYFEVNQEIFINGLAGVVYSIIDGKTITVQMPSTLPVGSGSVLTPGEVDQSSSSDANVILNNLSENTDCNAFCYGNGLESYRIRDSFNNSTMKYSIRASTVIEDYEEEDKFASLCYSGIFRGDSSINRLNEFNLSLANFKNLDKDYGSIQKIYARDSDLLVLHEDKITSVLFGKNLLVDALGGGQVASIPEVLGNQVPYQLDNGISNDPSSFAVNSDNIYFTDAKRGVVIEMIGNQGIMEISSKGMKNYFRDILTSNLNTQKIGAYDPYYNMYSLTTNDTSNRKCYLSISKPLTIFSNNGTLISIPLFSINSNAEWNIELIDAGSGTNWLELNFEQGNNNSNITGSPQINTSGILPREMTIRVHYCGSYVDHLIREVKYSYVVDTRVVIKPG
jgi:hypothetical protein